MEYLLSSFDTHLRVHMDMSHKDVQRGKTSLPTKTDN